MNTSSPAAESANPGVDERIHDGIATITLTRDAALNAFDGAQYVAVATALERAEHDPDVRCVLLTAHGRAFSAGSDLNDDGSEPDGYERFITRLERFPKPIVAAVNGLAVGIGATLLGHCDIVLASTDARFRLPFAAIGLVPEAGSTATMPAAMGPQATAHAMFTGGWISADDATAAGLVWRTSAPDRLLEDALEVCREIATKPLESLVATKRLLLDAHLPAVRAAREREEEVFRAMLDGDAHREAVAAFRRRD